jgi:hypothetical protein
MVTQQDAHSLHVNQTRGVGFDRFLPRNYLVVLVTLKLIYLD